jgi:hypothetical protein
MTPPNHNSVVSVGFLLALAALALVVHVKARRWRRQFLREPTRTSPRQAIGAWLALFGLIAPLPAWNLWQAVRFGKILNMPKYGPSHWEYMSTNPGWFWYTVVASALMLALPFALLAYALRIRRRVRQTAFEAVRARPQDDLAAPVATSATPERFLFGAIGSHLQAQRIVRRTAWAFIAWFAMLALALARHFTTQNLLLALIFGAPAAALLWSKDVVPATVLLGLCALVDLGGLLLEINVATGRHAEVPALHILSGVMLVLTYLAWRGFTAARYLKSNRASNATV